MERYCPECETTVHAYQRFVQRLKPETYTVAGVELTVPAWVYACPECDAQLSGNKSDQVVLNVVRAMAEGR